MDIDIKSFRLMIFHTKVSTSKHFYNQCKTDNKEGLEATDFKVLGLSLVLLKNSELTVGLRISSEVED